MSNSDKYLTMEDNSGEQETDKEIKDNNETMGYVDVGGNDLQEGRGDTKEPSTVEDEKTEDLSEGDGEEKSEDEEKSDLETDDEDSSDELQENAEELFRKLSAENRIMHRVIDDENLPPTVSLLSGSNGEKIYLIGTAHFSKESCDDVRKVISEAQPDVVVVELCRGRTDLLVNDEQKLLELAGDVSMSKIMQQVQHKGLISGLMTFLLLHMSAHITKQLGMAPGGEFRTAFHESRKVPGCKLMFGDRAVEVTLQRAFSKFSIWQKIKFAFSVLKDLGPIKPEDIEKLKEKDMLEQALSEMMGEFPEMTSVFLSERDIYLAHSFQKAASNQIQTESENTVPTVVVGVVGLGHAAGIRENFNREITEDQIKELVEVPTPSKTRRVVKFVVKVLFLAMLAYGAFRVSWWTGSSIYHWISSFLVWEEAGVHETEL